MRDTKSTGTPTTTTGGTQAARPAAPFAGGFASAGAAGVGVIGYGQAHDRAGDDAAAAKPPIGIEV